VAIIHAVFYGNPDRYPPIINGTRILSIKKYLVTIFCRATNEDIRVDYPVEVTVDRVGQGRGNSWWEYFGFAAKVLRTKHRDADFFMGHDMHGFLIARLLAWIYRKPLIYHCHEYVDRSTGSQLNWGGRLVYFFQEYFARTADLVIVPDVDRARLMMVEFKLPRTPLVVTNSPMDAVAFSGEKLHQALENKGKRFERVVIRQGSVGPSHAIETTLQSIPLWANKKWGFVILGPGQPDYIEELYRLAWELGVAEQFVVLPPVSYDEVLEFTCGADAGHSFYSPIDANNRYSTTASNKLMEYMAAGIPILASDRPSLRSFVEENQYGLVADESYPESIARVVNTLLADPVQMRQMGANGRQAFIETFCYRKQFAPVLDWLQT